MSDGTASAEFVSFDGGTRVASRVAMPDRYRFWDGEPPPTGISRGAGLSYVAASFAPSALSIEHSAFNRILDFDSDTGVIEVEAGTRLGAIFEFARRKGFYLAVQPGHPAITVGGCIAADVHGKHQQRDGTFCDQVESLRLFHARHGVFDTSRTVAPDWFDLTCGGCGLTGNILVTRLRLSRLPGHTMRLTTLPVQDPVSACHVLQQHAGKADLLYSWHDFSGRGRRFGRGFVVSGQFDRNSAPGEARRGSLTPDRIPTAAGRGMLRAGLMTRASVALINRAHNVASCWTRDRTVDLAESVFPVSAKMLYFTLFGRRGFHEYQAVVPLERFHEFIDAVERRLARDRIPIALASGKLFGGQRRWLRFTGGGICFALDFPRSSRSAAFASFLDEVLQRCGGWPNIMKDSRLSASVVAATYPDYEMFRGALRKLDPARLYRSELSDRLQL